MTTRESAIKVKARFAKLHAAVAGVQSSEAPLCMPFLEPHRIPGLHSGSPGSPNVELTSASRGGVAICGALGCWRSLALFACAAAPAALAEKRIALLISNKDDKPGVRALVNPLNGVAS